MNCTALKLDGMYTGQPPSLIRISPFSQLWTLNHPQSI
uniref:Uncharacterized protein n=1 Tax=Rhizophora mucronata TaxID=61149 RepID=A0A2P2QZZ1_RHIMU